MPEPFEICASIMVHRRHKIAPNRNEIVLEPCKGLKVGGYRHLIDFYKENVFAK
jgi:hypothetical protein